VLAEHLGVARGAVEVYDPVFTPIDGGVVGLNPGKL